MDHAKIVDYCKFCNKCKHYELKGTAEPCEECLTSPVNMNSKKPIKFEEGNTVV